MNELEFQAYIENNYGVTGERMWEKHPTFRVFRHRENRKWFAVIMGVPRDKLGLSGTEELPVVNLKCDTRMIGDFRREPGIFPGWHMNKAYWLTVSLDGTVAEDKLRFLLDMSYELTKSQKKKD